MQTIPTNGNRVVVTTFGDAGRITVSAVDGATGISFSGRAVGAPQTEYDGTDQNAAASALASEIANNVQP